MNIELPFAQNEKKWYFLSLFYAREKWLDMITFIFHFYEERQNQFTNYLISLSVEKGEHLQVTFVSSGNDNINYTDEIQTCFRRFLDQNPSVNKIPFPYGKAVWSNYPNNSLAWNKFKLPDYSEQYISFHQQTVNVAMKLLADDFSEDSVFSLGIYLLTKALGCIDNKEQKSILSQAYNSASVSSPHFVYAAKELLSEIPINEVLETIDLYQNENSSEYSPELISWLNEVKIILFNNFNYNDLCTFIFKITGLTGLRQLMILELLNIWYNLQ